MGEQDSAAERQLAFDAQLAELETAVNSPFDDSVIETLFRTLDIQTDEDLARSFQIVEGTRPEAAETIKDEWERLWQLKANCIEEDPDLFFPERGASAKAGKAICEQCEVITECLEYALARGQKTGIWGGKTERERRLILRTRLLSDRS